MLLIVFCEWTEAAAGDDGLLVRRSAGSGGIGGADGGANLGWRVTSSSCSSPLVSGWLAADDSVSP